MIGLLVGWGLSEKAAKAVLWIVLPVVVLVAFYLLLDAYGDSRFRAGEQATDARWKEAAWKLEAQAAAAASTATAASVARVMDYNAKVADDKERLDAAAVDGSSPLDVLFGNSAGGVR